MSVLEQDHFKYDEYFVLETVIMGNPRLYQIMKEKDELLAELYAIADELIVQR